MGCLKRSAFLSTSLFDTRTPKTENPDTDETMKGIREPSDANPKGWGPLETFYFWSTRHPNEAEAI